MIGIILTAIIGIAVIAAVTLLPHKVNPVNKDYYKKKWQEIVALIRDPNSSDIHYKMVVIEADKLFDHAMKAKKIKGETMGERLKTLGSSASNINDVWRVHKLRNKLVHEPDASVNRRQSSDALRVYKRALKDIGVV